MHCSSKWGDDITSACYKFAMIMNVVTSTANISKTTHKNWMKISPQHRSGVLMGFLPMANFIELMLFKTCRSQNFIE